MLRLIVYVEAYKAIQTTSFYVAFVSCCSHFGGVFGIAPHPLDQTLIRPWIIDNRGCRGLDRMDRVASCGGGERERERERERGRGGSSQLVIAVTSGKSVGILTMDYKTRLLLISAIKSRCRPIIFCSKAAQRVLSRNSNANLIHERRRFRQRIITCTVLQLLNHWRLNRRLFVLPILPHPSIHYIPFH